ANPAIDDYAYSAEDLLVWDYDGSQWVETDQIVPDQMTPASDANPQADGTVTAGTSTEYSRGDHILPLNTSTTTPNSDSANGAVGTSVNYARSDHSHPINISSDLPLQYSTGSVGTSNYYATSDHQHPINVETNASNIPIVNGIGNNGLTIGQSYEIGAANRRQHISADGNTLSFNESVIAGTGAQSGASNGSVNYSAGNPILWGLNSVGTEGGFYSDGPKVYWRAKPVTLGAVRP
ncbi:MAG: hypothetical protein EZS28_025438, partial [Streblomastix strix]